MNQNFTIKAYRPIAGRNIECKVYSCRSYNFKLCPDSGIVLTANGLSGTDENATFSIPSTIVTPKVGDYTKLIVENMAGHTVDLHKYRGDKIFPDVTLGDLVVGIKHPPV